MGGYRRALAALVVVPALSLVAGALGSTVSAAAGWVATTAPTAGLNPAAGSNPTTGPSAVSCPAAGSCVAVGSYFDSSNVDHALIESQSGGNWTATTAPVSGLSPAAGSGSFVFLSSIACPAAGSCVAVGTYLDSSSINHDLIETLSAGTWTARNAPLTGLSPPAGTSGSASLEHVSCPASGSCVAVGQYQDSSSNGQGLIETLSAGTWTAKAAPLSGLSPPAATNPNASVNVLSCPTSGFCVAFGGYQDSSNNFHAMIETLSSGTWTATTAPTSGLSPAPKAPPQLGITSVACPTTGSCAAVGSYLDSSGAFQGLIETLSAGTWSATTAPVTGLVPAAGTNPSVGIDSVSCAASGSCVAVGSYKDTSAHGQALIETLASGTWHATTAPLSGLNPPAGTDPQAVLDAPPGSVSCPGLGSCVAVGRYTDTSGHQQGLIETLASGTWSPTTAPLSGLNPTAGTNPVASLPTLSCAAVGSCVAVGFYTDTAGHQQGLIETITGAQQPQSNGGFILDDWGGIHPFHTGSLAPPAITQLGPYWPGQDVARGIASLAGGGYVVDDWGGIHPYATGGSVGNAHGGPYWPGQNVARGIALLPDGTGGYVLDDWGGLHPFAVGSNAAPPLPQGGPYWLGQDVARGVAVLRDGSGGYVVDDWGAFHPFVIPGTGHSMPAKPTDGPYWVGQNVVRGVVADVEGNGGYVVDDWGGAHTFSIPGTTGAVPTPSGGPYWPGQDVARGISVVP